MSDRIGIVLYRFGRLVASQRNIVVLDAETLEDAPGRDVAIVRVAYPNGDVYELDIAEDGTIRLGASGHHMVTAGTLAELRRAIDAVNATP